MSAKKRVYELAKELGIDNKELIARLAGMGIVVKTHSSTLEDSEVERVKREFLASQPHELVEKRVKATVIRRGERKRKSPNHIEIYGVADISEDTEICSRIRLESRTEEGDGPVGETD